MINLLISIWNHAIWYIKGTEYDSMVGDWYIEEFDDLNFESKKFSWYIRPRLTKHTKISYVILRYI